MRKNIKTIMLFVTAFVLFGITSPVYASYDGDIYVETNIDRWSPANDLQFYSTRCSSAVIEGVDVNGNDLSVNLDCGTEVSLGFEFDGSDSSWNNYPYKFKSGSVVTVRETLDYSNESCGATLCQESEIGNFSETSLSLNIPDSEQYKDEMIEKTFDNVSTDTYNVYMDRVYEDEYSNYTVSYIYLNDGGTKGDTINLGTILLPIYKINYDLSAKGNFLPRGYWSIEFDSSDTMPYALSDVEFNFDKTSETDVGGPRTDGTYIDRGVNNNGNYYSFLSYSMFDRIGVSKILDVKYIGVDTVDNNVSSAYSTDYSLYSTEFDRLSKTTGNVSAVRRAYNPNQNVGIVKADSSDDNTYVYTLNQDIENNVSVPNGIFYNIIPFILIIAVAGIGIVIIKKRSVEE